MSTTNAKPPRRTKIAFVMEDHMSAEEISRFKESAAEAGAPNETEHFLNLTLRLPEQSPKHAA